MATTGCCLSDDSSRLCWIKESCPVSQICGNCWLAWDSSRGFALALIWLWFGFDLAWTLLWLCLDLAWVWLWFGLDFALVWLGFGLDLAWIWLWFGFDLASIWLGSGFDLAWICMRLELWISTGKLNVRSGATGFRVGMLLQSVKMQLSMSSAQRSLQLGVQHQEDFPI